MSLSYRQRGKSAENKKIPSEEFKDKSARLVEKYTNIIYILKTISAIVIGGSNQFLTINWGFDYSGAYQAQNIYIPTQVSYEYGVAEYNIAEYTSGVPIKTLTANASGAGKIVQTGYETTINNVSFSLQKIEIQAKDGKIG